MRLLRHYNEGVWYDDKALELRALWDESCGRHHYAVFARRDLKEGEEVVRVPKRACLSPATCQAAPLLREAQLGGGLALNIAIMHEVTINAEVQVEHIRLTPRVLKARLCLSHLESTFQSGWFSN